MEEFEREISRRVFLRGTVKIFALTSLTFSGVDCFPSRDVPALRGISEQEYRNMHSLAEVFLEGSPIRDLDIGKALDDYVFGHPYPIDTKDAARELAGVPSSILAALVLDGSFTPLVKLPKEERLKRMLAWKASENPMKRGLFNIMRQTVFFLVSSSPEFIRLTGYNMSEELVPYRG